MGKSSGKDDFVSVIRSLAILIVIVFAFKWSVLDANNIPSGSMIPTLKIGDYLFVNKMRYSIRIPYTEIELWRFDNPSRGDIITFIPPPPGDSGKQYVKRVMGMPGDRIRIRNIPACELSRYEQESMESPGIPEEGRGRPVTQMVHLAMNQEIQRDYSCDPTIPGQPGYSEPMVALVEYKKNDTGPWKNYHPEELSARETKRLLYDSDNVNVLYPDEKPLETRRFLPVVFRETINGHTHLMVEGSDAVESYNLCPEIEDEGCLIPENYYLVMGDNRDDSKDSRYIGLINRDSILGKAVVTYFSINWRDEICYAYSTLYADNAPQASGFSLPDFGPSEQKRYCSRLDAQSGYESAGSYLKRTILYRIPRMSVRWYRIGTILK